ncbi:MAG TPA: exodeoxyribonuclease VII small subunit [Candidatus Saccharimonadales bacterium]|nr:exodeoxyribonuclease VII small subunit [Candidatus Saccharimonadales bacterium]
MAKAKQTATYSQMADQLNSLVEWFESDQVNLDQAVGKYEEAMELLGRMEQFLKDAENKVKKIAVKFESD